MSEALTKNSESKDSKSEPSPFTAPKIELSKGGGAIRGIGEKFSANSATGTGTLSVPLALSPGRTGFGPELSLSYDSGSENGAFGIGWSVALPAITYKTDKGLPKYGHREDEECDVFILSGSEDLVPVLLEDGQGGWVHDEFEREGYRVKRYRPRIEGLFARIERWTRLADGDEHWRSISKENTLTVYGRNEASRIFDPSNCDHVFSWRICESYDDKGNAIVYEYEPENDQGVDLAKASERGRIRTANRYLKRIRYGNRRPLLLDDRSPSFRLPHLELPGLENTDWMFEAVFDYGDENYRLEQDADGRVWVHCTPGFQSGSHWPVRKDPFSTYRSGFEVRTYRLCQRVLMFHHFPEEPKGSDCLVRSTEFEYRQKALGSFITKVTHSGYARQVDCRYLKKSMPALDLDYTSSPLEDEGYHDYQVKEVDSSSCENLPAGIDEENYRWIDLDGEGISGILTEQGSAWYYKPNAGCGRLSPTELIVARPSLAALNQGRQQLLDVAGDGTQELVQFNSPAPGFYQRTMKERWGSFRTFRSLPVLDWNDPNLKFVDITGDGIADILITEDDAFIWHASLLDEGFGPAIRVAVPTEERKGPHVIFADGIQSIYLADMSGDGLSDLVRIRNGEVCYWPNHGYGKFGRKVTMDNAPWFEVVDLFEQSRVKLADTDGSGTTDILYMARDGIRIYLNQAGNAWSDARVLRQFAPVNVETSVSVIDFLGRGTACLLWSSTLPADARKPLRYLDLTDGQKPHLLIKVQNNLGAETRIEYASSTEFYLADKAAGRPWLTRLPFPVHVVKRVETYDYVSRNRFVSSYTYHHGFFDGLEREFRGFAMVEQLDTEDFAALRNNASFPVGTNVDSYSNVPPTLTKTWFHTGVFLGNRRVSRHLALEYYREPETLRSPGGADSLKAMLLDDTILPDWLNAEEAREACRALKGSMLRQEVYALDGKEESSRPYSVAESNFNITTLQRRQQNLHAVFFAHPRETLTFHYERKLYEIDGVEHADPRVEHSLTLNVDDFGNVLESATVGYGRRFADCSPLLTEADRVKQRQLLLTFTENRFTNAVQERDAYGMPLPAESRTYQVIHVRPSSQRLGVTNLFRFEELKALIACASDGRHDVTYEDVDFLGATETVPYRRLIEESRSYYRADRLDRILPLGLTEALGLPGESYKLAFTPGLLAEVYRRHESLENLIPDVNQVLRQEAKYVELTGGHWWVPSGRIFYASHECDAASELEQARRHFFLPRRFLDPFNSVTTVGYDSHDLMPVQIRDAIGNITSSEIDYRVLAPRRMTDANRNRSEVAFDALGMVVGTAVMGKQTQRAGDSLDAFDPNLDEATILEQMAYPLRHPHAILGMATTRMVYDLFAYARTRDRAQPEPAAVYTLARESHAADLCRGELTKIQHSFSYSDGFGREIQKKIQAEPGRLTSGGPDVNPRWVGSGWIIFNNKGKPVRQYEPFFTAVHTFEFANIVGVSSILFYDPVQRVVATLHANHTYEKVVFDPWQNETWDVNDTVLINPAQDPDVGDFFAKLPQSDYLPTWHDQRSQGQLGREEQQTALKTTVHANTPSLAYADTLGRTFLSIVHNRFERAGAIVDQHFATRTELDIENNQRSVIDALGRVVMRYDYNMLSTRLRQISVDAGTRWMLNDAVGKLLLAWDSRFHRFRHEYDALHRPTNLHVLTGGNAEILAERIVYGEGQPNDLALNLRGKAFRQFDGAGIVDNERYDFKGNLLNSARQLLEDYKNEVNWAQSPELQEPVFTTARTYDALNRPITLTTPDASVALSRYNEANLLESLAVNLRGADEQTSFVTFINYNAKGQREIIDYGNGAHTRYTYDPLTFRMIHMLTRRKQDHARLQDLHYTFDPVGNITSIRDDSQETIYFKNEVVSPSNEYVYDAIYRLISADGREHAGKRGHPQTTDDDLPRMNNPLPSDGHALHRYREQYEYDPVGNILRLIHAASDGNWSRHYLYNESHSRQRNNRLTNTRVGQDLGKYAYDAAGNVTRMPHLPNLDWDFKDQLHATRQQVTDTGRGETTYYVYDSSGQRLRKVTERASGSRKHERIYLGSFEIYRKYDSVGIPTLERETLQVMDDKRRIALVESKTINGDGFVAKPTPLLRLQFDNHLKSSALELDEAAVIISYEEFYPFGSTSYEAVDHSIKAARKRYRFTGRERDEETGLYYHGARYYAPWLGRWTSCDPAGVGPGSNAYEYVHGNPVGAVDPGGAWPEWFDKKLGQAKELVQRTAANASATAHAVVEGAIWNSTVMGRITDDARRVIDTNRGFSLEKWAGNNLGRTERLADRATSSVITQIKSTRVTSLRRIAQQARDATRDAAQYIAENLQHAGKAEQAHIIVPTGTPARVIGAAENALQNAGPAKQAARNLTNALPPKVTSGLAGVGGKLLKVLAPIGAAMSAYSLGEDYAKGDAAHGVADLAGTVSGGLESFALASTAAGASGSGTAAAAGVGGIAGGGAAAAATTGAAVTGAFALGATVGIGIQEGSAYASKKLLGREISPGQMIGDTLTAVDRTLARAVADPNKPAYTQTLGWKIANWLTPSSN
jgi:RHS repeat-associated protein